MKLEANRRLHAYRLKRATLVIQNVVAYFVFQRRARRNYASVIIQASWRESLVREHYCSVSVAAIAMQSMVRGRLSLVSYRRMLHASLILQTYIRWRQATKRFKECVFAILCIQKYWRGSLSRHSLMVARASAIFIQALTRGILTRHAYEYFIMPPEERKAFDDAARRIQVAFYMWMMQMAVLEMNSSAVLLRRSVRGQLVRSAAKFALTHMNSSFRSRSLASFSRVVSSSDPEVISTTVAWNVAVNFAKSSASIVIQSAARRMIARKYVIFLFGRSFGSSARIAAQREEEQRSAATLLIQRSFRLWSAGRRGPAILIQKTFRAWNARNLFSQGVEARDLQQKQPNSAMLVQALARGLLSRKTHAQTIAAAVSVQTAHRRYLAQISFRYRKAFEARELQQKRSTLAMLVQALARRSTARKVFVQKVAAAVTIQNVNRRFLAQTSFLRYRVAALAAQRVARGWIGRRKSERRQAASILVTRSSLFEKALSSRSQVDEVYSRIVRKAEKVSAKVFGSLLEDRLSGDAGPCLLRLANRVRNTLDDANFVSKNALDETDIFGVGAIAEELASKKQGGDQMVAPDVSTPSKKQAHQSYSATGLPQIEASPPSPQKADTRVSRKVETPVRCNRTPTAQSFFACLDYEKDQDTKPTARVISLDFKPADFDAKATPDQRIAPPAEKPSKPEAKTLPKVAPSGSDASARLAAEAKRLLSLGRQVLHSKPAAAPAEPKISLTTPYETATATKKNDAGDEQLFGQAEEEPLSPIKAETNWDWADEW
jgi:phosphoheptose isomerase